MQKMVCDSLQSNTQPNYAGGKFDSLPSSSDVHHRAGWLEEAGFTDMVARFLLLYRTEDVLAEFPIAGPCAHAPIEIVFHLRE
jgi:hypothetical protein